jgi:hypothetical protein
MFRSVRSIVIAPANTGSDSRRRIAVILIPQEEAPARCIEKIARSTDGPACAMFPASGG